MYKIQVVVVNPMQHDGTGDSERLLLKFDQKNFTAEKWQNLFPEVQSMISKLQERSTEHEPRTL